jgi:centrosomal protein CEP41
MSDERKGVAAANIFYEKGYENTYLLSGGIEQFLEEYTSLCEGKAIPITKSIIKCKI